MTIHYRAARCIVRWQLHLFFSVLKITQETDSIWNSAQVDLVFMHLQFIKHILPVYLKLTHKLRLNETVRGHKHKAPLSSLCIVLLSPMPVLAGSKESTHF